MTVKMPQKHYKEMLSLNIVVTKDMFLIQIYLEWTDWPLKSNEFIIN